MGIKDFLSKRFSHLAATESDEARKNDILLVSSNDGTWSATVDSATGGSSGVFLTLEGSYPAELYYVRTDINGSDIYEKDICQDQQEVLESLNWIGQCGHRIVSLWDFDEDKSISQDLQDIFNAAWEHKCEILREAADEMLEAVMEDVELDMQKPSLSEKIHSAGDRKNSCIGNEPQEKYFER